MQREPGLRGHRQKILARREISEIVRPDVVGGGFGLLGDSVAGVMAVGLEEEQDRGVFHRVSAVARDHTVQRGYRRQPEDQVFCLLALAGDDGGVVISLVVVVEGGEEAPPGGRQFVLGRGQAFHGKAAVVAGDDQRDGLVIRSGKSGYRNPGHRLSGGRVHHGTGDAIESGLWEGW